MTTISAEEAPGTKVLLVKRNESNPCRQPEHQPLFHNGYWEIHLSCDGSNPFFRPGLLKLLLVSQSQPRVEFTLDTPNNLNFIAIDNGTEVTGITTKVTTFSDSGIDYLVPALIVSVSNPNGVFGEIKMSVGDLFPFVSSTRQ